MISPIGPPRRAGNRAKTNSNTNRGGTELFRCGELYPWMTVRKSFGKNPGNV